MPAFVRHTHLVQSRPATGSGQGLQNGCVASTAWQLGPRHRAGIGFIAHIEPAGSVPLLKNVPLMRKRVPATTLHPEHTVQSDAPSNRHSVQRDAP